MFIGRTDAASGKVNEKKEPIKFGRRRRRVSRCREVRTQEKVVSKGGEQLFTVHLEIVMKK